MEDKIPFKVKFKLMKWAIVAFAITLAEMILVTAVSFIFIPEPYRHWVLLINYSAGLPIGLYYIILVMSGYKRRKTEYLKLRKLFLENPDKPIKKSILIKMDFTLCEKEVSNQLRREFLH